MQLHHNIFKIYLIKGLTWFMLAMPIIVLFFQEHGLTLTEVMILQSIYSLTVALVEIPSGYFADYFGRKNSIILSCIFLFLGYLIFSNYVGFAIFVLAEILLALGSALMSGADSAIMYDTLLEIDKKESYTKFEGRTYAIGNFSEAIAGLIGGFLATVSLLLPFQIQALILFFSIPVAFTLVEPSVNNNHKNRGSWYFIFKSVRYSITQNTILLWIIIYSSILGVASLAAAWLAQPFFKLIDIPLYYYGVLWASLNFIAGIGSYRSHKDERRFNIENLLLNLGLLMSVAFLLVYFLSNYYGIIFIFLIYYLRGVLTPILKNQINLNTESNIRATMMSVRGFLLRISFAIIAPILGFIADNKGVDVSFLFISCLAFCIILPVVLIMKRSRSKNIE